MYLTLWCQALSGRCFSRYNHPSVPLRERLPAFVVLKTLTYGICFMLTLLWRTLLLFSLFISLLSPVYGQSDSTPTTGFSGFSFLRLPATARMAALGDLFPAWPADATGAMFYNPAFLNASMHRQLSVSYLNHLTDIYAGTLAFSWHQKGVGSWGIGLRFINYGTFEAANEQGIRTGTFGASEGALSVGIGRSFQAIRYGLLLNLLFSRIEQYHAGALSVEAGMQYTPDQATTVSASIHHIGWVFNSLGSTRDRLPLDIRIGIARRLQHLPLHIGLTAYNLNNFSGTEQAFLRHLVWSGEFVFSPAFQIRVGYNFRRHEDLKTKSRLDFAGVSAGFGLRIHRFTLDYAFNSWSSTGSLHFFTLRTLL